MEIEKCTLYGIYGTLVHYTDTPQNYHELLIHEIFYFYGARAGTVMIIIMVYYELKLKLYPPVRSLLILVYHIHTGMILTIKFLAFSVVPTSPEGSYSQFIPPRSGTTGLPPHLPPLLQQTILNEPPLSEV